MKTSGLGRHGPDSSAVLDVSIEALSRPRGMLIPRMTEQERDAIIFPARGLLIFNTTRNRIEMNIGDRTTPVWARFVTYGESSGGDWALTGNAGIDPSRNFLGTVDAAPLIFKTDARERMRITPIGAVGIGTVTPLGLFAVGPNSEFYVDSSGTIHGVQLWLQGSNARLYIDGSSGIAGDVLVSSGPNAPQRWTKQLDSLGITSLRSSTVSSRSVVTDTLRAQYIVGGIPFDSVKSGVNQNQTLTVGNGSTVEASGTGIVRANRVNLTGTNAPLETNGNAGTSGQLLKSKGAGQTPEWTWSLDSLDVRRLTTGHIWSDTVTADSVRGRVGRFDSLIVDFLRGDTAYISSLRIDSLYSSGGVLRAAVPFDSVKSGVNQNQTLTVGNGSTVEASGTGIVRANRVNLTGTNAPLETNGNAGTSGQLLKSKGAGQTPEWTWRLDSVDVVRLTADHIWTDTLTADSVRARVGRFDSLLVDFVRGDTAYISSLRVDSIFSTGVLRAAIPFDSVKSGVNQNQTLTVGNGSTVEASGTGIVRANRVNLTGTNAPLETNGNAGTSGQLLKSKGAGQTPEWTWRLDSLDVGRLTAGHVWSDTVTADSVRGRVGRFDSLIVDFVRGDTAYISSLRVDSIFSTGVLRAAVPFDSVKSGVNQNQTLTVGNGSTVEASGTGIVRANRVNLTGTNAPLETNGNAGTSGQLLKSKGAGQTPEWTWRLDSLDVGRLTVEHVWSDTLTADSVRARVGRFDSVMVDFVRGDTAYISSLRIDSLYSSGGVLRAAIPFDSVKSGVNQNQTLTVGNGSTVEASGTGIVRANRVNLTGTNAPLETNGNAGTSGQLLKSKGAGQTPEWTWRLDSLDVGRLTVEHVWSDTLTADSVRARVGRFDSLVVDFVRGDTAYISSLRVDSIFSTGVLRAAVPFDSVKSGVNQNQTLTVGNGSTVEASGTGIVRANRVNLTGTNAPLETNGNAGTSGQLLKSKGAGATPEWTWSLDSLDIRRLTTGHVWSDTVTADSVRGRVGRFDSLLVDFVRGDTGYISSLRVDSIFSTGVLRAAVPFDSVKSGVNQNQTLTVGNGSTVEASGTGIVRANRVNLTGTNAPLETNGSAGTSGQLLKSKGAGATPEWTWSLDSLDVGRLTAGHVWSDTVTADSVRGRVGRFDSLVVDFVRGDTAYISSLRVDSIFSTGVLRAAVPFDSVKSGVNQNQTLTVGNGSTVEASGTGIVRANRVNLTGTNAPLETNGNAGTSGQLLKSKGAGQTPEWTWRLDSVDVVRLTADHIWSDTLTADSVRARVGRFDSVMVGSLRAAIPFDSVKSGVNQNQTLTVGNGSTVEASGTGIVRANRVNLTGTNAPLETNGNAGTSGQLLKSKGAGQTPEWTWRLDSLDVGRLTADHIWSDTLTADSVRARVGRFDSVMVGSLRAAIPFDSVKSGVNQNQTLTVGSGSVLSATGTGIVRANRVNLTGANAPLETNGSAGTSGQLLKSKGAGQTPEWTWSLDSLDIRRLTTGHVWSDTVTADSVRGRVGRFDSLVVSTLKTSVPFDSVKSGVNQNQTLTVGNGSTVEASGTGIVRANRVNLTGANAPLETNGNAGTSGQLLKSKGAGQTPEWTWRLDSVDVVRLTADHIWTDTLTADSVRARVGRFDSLLVDFVRGDTAYISSLRVDSIFSTGVLRAAIPFDSVKSGVNQNQTLTVGNGSTVEASGTGIVRANRVNLTGTNAPLETNGNAGTSGQLLKSKGAGQTPEWTWRLDSLDVGRLTAGHVWSDTVTADSVRGRVGRFDSLIVDFVRGDTAYISSLRVDSIFSTGVLRAAVPFDSVKSGVNQNQTLTVGNGSTVEASGTGIVRANRVNLTGTNAPLETNGNAGHQRSAFEEQGGRSDAGVDVALGFARCGSANGRACVERYADGRFGACTGRAV
ncbi:MAG: hypothetical protein KatS3mg038_2257 [Candidatus Kapaibacterium sp.]|nr:MAG: hypothetical protein KatS3mg038_2257 [Candidatus Kapabacteria bacterium]